jgi:methyl-accepting chemotaxis protein
MKIGNLRIGIRLAICFTIMICATISIATVSITKLYLASTAINEIVNNCFTKTLYSNEILIQVNENGRNVRNAMLARNDGERKKFLDRAAISDKALSEIFPKFDKIINTSAERSIMNDVDHDRAEFDQMLAQVRRLAADGKREQATELLFSKGIPLQDVYFKHLKSMKEFQISVTSKLSAESIAGAKFAIALVIGLSIAIVLFTILAAILITRSITQPLKNAVHVAQLVASGDLTSQATVTSKDETGQLLSSLQEMIRSLHHVVGEVRAGVSLISTASGQIASGNLDLSSRTEEQASSLEETASAMEELVSTVKQNADNAIQAKTSVVSASEAATKAGHVVSQVVHKMTAINDASSRISEIISVMDGIAFQTNLLALNAAVEAARAGEQGRGFAVVAGEVRALAQRSASAAREIKSLISDSVEQVEGGSKLAEEAGHAMNAVVLSFRKVSTMVGDISAASQEQSSGIEQINRSIAQMDDVTQQNAALVEEAAAASQSLKEQAAKLSLAVSVFKLESSPLPEANKAVGEHARALAIEAGSNRRAVKTAKHEDPSAGVFKSKTESQWQEF